MRRIKYIINIGLFISLFAVLSCTDDFDEMNTNPNAATTIEPKYLLTNSFRRGAMDYATYYYTQGYASFLCQYIANSNQGHITDAYFYSDPWNATFWSRNYAENYAGFLGLADHAMDLANENGLVNQEAQAKIWRAFLFHRMTDIWGAIPYFEAFDDNNLTPGYTSQQEIYYDLFTQLEEAVNLIDAEKGWRMGTADILLGDDLTKWRRFANGLRMRLAMRISEVDPAKAQSEFEAALNATDGPLQSNKDNVGLVTDPAGPAALRDDNPLRVVANYFPNWFKLSETFIDMLEDLDDPRIYSFAAPRQDYLKNMQEAYQALDKGSMSDDDVEFTDEVIGVIRSTINLFAKGPDYLDEVEAFIKEKTGKSDDDPLFDRYKGLRNGQSATALSEMQNKLSDYSQLSEFIKDINYPTYCLVYPEVCFLKAEAALKGWSVGGTAEEFYNEGVLASQDMYGIEDEEAAAYLERAAFKSGESAEKQLEQIMFQKYLANFTNGFEGWSEWRRTGYPVLLQAVSNGDTEGRIPRRWNYTYDEKRFNEESLNAAIQAMGGVNDMMTPNWWDQNFNSNPQKWQTVESYDYLNLKVE